MIGKRENILLKNCKITNLWIPSAHYILNDNYCNYTHKVNINPFCYLFRLFINVRKDIEKILNEVDALVYCLFIKLYYSF